MSIPISKCFFFILLAIIWQVNCSEKAANESEIQEECSSDDMKYVVLLLDELKGSAKPEVIGVGTLLNPTTILTAEIPETAVVTVSVFVTPNTAVGTGIKQARGWFGNLFKNIGNWINVKIVKPIVNLFTPDPEPEVHHHYHQDQSTRQKNVYYINNTIQNITKIIKNITIINYYGNTYHVESTAYNLTNIMIDKNITLTNVNIQNVHYKSVPLAKGRGMGNIAVIKIEEGLLSIQPDLKFVKLPVPEMRSRSASSPSWPSDWPNTRKYEKDNLSCKGATVIGFKKKYEDNSTGIASVGTMEHGNKKRPYVVLDKSLECLVDRKGDGQIFVDNCHAPYDGPLICGDVQMGIIAGGQNCDPTPRRRRIKTADSFDFISSETMFDFVVEHLQDEKKRSKKTSSTVRPYTNNSLILTIIVFWVFK
ncbi:unnamed protein product [Ceutorhynchus assimilis]|uniref:Peptidase S1 domain-containing protein n=1 Tax=Ceutorhynchus assimilis TaxID=467358 RepID=A0A9N9QIF5_9CUCU|nr:unnamed protein product [Ceutorhynchus assimilis]